MQDDDLGGNHTDAVAEPKLHVQVVQNGEQVHKDVGEEVNSAIEKEVPELGLALEPFASDSPYFTRMVSEHMGQCDGLSKKLKKVAEAAKRWRKHSEGLAEAELLFSQTLAECADQGESPEGGLFETTSGHFASVLEASARARSQCSLVLENAFIEGLEEFQAREIEVTKSTFTTMSKAQHEYLSSLGHYLNTRSSSKHKTKQAENSSQLQLAFKEGEVLRTRESYELSKVDLTRQINRLAIKRQETLSETMMRGICTIHACVHQNYEAGKHMVEEFRVYQHKLPKLNTLLEEIDATFTTAKARVKEAVHGISVNVACCRTDADGKRIQHQQKPRDICLDELIQCDRATSSNANNFHADFPSRSGHDVSTGTRSKIKIHGSFEPTSNESCLLTHAPSVALEDLSKALQEVYEKSSLDLDKILGTSRSVTHSGSIHSEGGSPVSAASPGKSRKHQSILKSRLRSWAHKQLAKVEDKFGLHSPSNESISSTSSFDTIVMEGYLRKRSSKLRKTWKRKWFILRDAKLVYIRESTGQPELITECLLATVREADPLLVNEMPFCFEILTPQHKTVMLQAEDGSSMRLWMEQIRQCTERMIHNEPAPPKHSQSVDFNSTSAQEESSVSNQVHPGQLSSDDELRELQFCNDKCADCSAPQPDWAVINMGILVCVECAGIHRSLGVHISKVRSVKLDAWSEASKELLRVIGNNTAALVWEGAIQSQSGWVKPTAVSPREEKERFIKAKYEWKGFVRQPPTPESHPSHEGENLATSVCDCGQPLTVLFLDSVRKENVTLVQWYLVHGVLELFTKEEELHRTTPLHVVAETNSVAICELLLQNGARALLPRMNESGQTASSLATHPDVAALLRDA